MRIQATYRHDAPNRGDIERFQETARTFVAEWAREPETQQLFADVRKATKLGRKAAALRFLQSWKPEAPVPALSKIQEQIDSHIATYVTLRVKTPNAGLTALLSIAFLQDLGGRTTGKPARRHDRIESLVPRPVLVYGEPEGMTETEARRRLKQAYGVFKKACARWERARRRGSRGPRENVKRESVWLFRHVLKSVPVRDLAREYRDACKTRGVDIASDGHEHVLAGLKRAAQILGLEHLIRIPR